MDPIPSRCMQHDHLCDLWQIDLERLRLVGSGCLFDLLQEDHRPDLRLMYPERQSYLLLADQYGALSVLGSEIHCPGPLGLISVEPIADPTPKTPRPLMSRDIDSMEILSFVLVLSIRRAAESLHQHRRQMF